MEEQEKLIEKINMLSDSIRKKNRALKSDISERDAFLESTFKPVVGPLQEISKKLNTSDIKAAELMPLVKTKLDEIESQDSTYSDNNMSADEEEEEEEMRAPLEEQGEGLTEEEEETLKSHPSRLTLLSQDIGYKGDLTKKYVLKLLHSTLPKRNYHVYGARLTDDGLMVGDSNIRIDNSDNVSVKNRTFKGTEGLFELLFTKDPKNYTRKDLDTFKTICKLTNAHKRGYSSNSPIYRNRSIKYKNIIKKIFPISTTGKGMMMKNVYDTNVIYYNNVNKLVNRLQLLYEAKDAGHTGVDNEIIALVEELRERGYIL